MTEINETPVPDVPAEETEVQQNFVTRLAVKHPRTARVVALTGAAVAVGGVLLTANTVKKNRQHLVAAGESASDAISHISDAVSPTDTTV